VISVDGVDVAVDVCSVTIDPRWPQAIKRAERVLGAALEEAARRAGVVVDVTLVPQTGPPGEPWGEEYYQRIIDVARGLLPCGPSDEDVEVDDDTYVQVVPHPQTDDGRHVVVHSWLSSSPDVRKSTEEALTAPVEKKLTGQLANAKSSGYPVILLLDQVAPSDTGLWRQFMASPSTIALAVAPLLVSHPSIVDEVWLRDSAGTMHSVTELMNDRGLL
jgi:hypothetical protein